MQKTNIFFPFLENRFHFTLLKLNQLYDMLNIVVMSQPEDEDDDGDDDEDEEGE